MRKTKIVVTLGPAVKDYEKLREIFKYANIARFNFSHGDHRSHKEMKKMVEEISEELEKPITLMADLKGPEVRTTNKEPVEIKKGEAYSLEDIGFSFSREFENTLAEGDVVLIDDGKLTMVAEEKGGEFYLRAKNAYTISPKRGVIIRGKDFPLPSITSQDRADIEFISKEGFHAIAQSFVRRAEDVRELRRLAGDVIIIAKIESVDGAKNVVEILDEADGVMVARGDLALAVGEEKVPPLQIEIIEAAKDRKKPVIVATQMLESMTTSPFPTRAEVSDIYSAVWQGADALMLSGETSKGDYPVESVKVMDRVIITAEANTREKREKIEDFKDIIASSASRLAEHFHVPLIAPTMHGTTPRKLSYCRPKVPIYVITPRDRTLHYLNFFYGIFPRKGDFEPVFERFEELKAKFGVKKAVFVFGYPPGNHRTNAIIHI